MITPQENRKSRRMGGGRDRAKKPLAVTLVGLLTFAGLAISDTVSPKLAHAEFADGSGLSEYQSIIDWVDWDSAVDGGIKRDLTTGGTTIDRRKFPLTQVSETQIGDGKLVTTCVVHGGYADRSTTQSNSLKAYRPGWNYGEVPSPDDRSYQGDAFNHYYAKNRTTRNGVKDNRGLAAGIGGMAGHRRFDISCSSKMVRPGVPEKDIPVKGLAFANAETIDNVEAIAITPAVHKDKELQWHLLEHENRCAATSRQYIHRGDLYGGAFDMYKHHNDSPVRNNGKRNQNPQRKLRFYYSEVDRSGARTSEPISTYPMRNDLRVDDSIMMSSPNKNCWEQHGEHGSNADNADNFGPFTTLYADNAYGAEVMFHNRGGNAIAVGVVIGLDMGDVPGSYGSASALVQPSVVGGEIAKGVTDALSLAKAEIVPVSSPRFGEKVDIETEHFLLGDKWQNIRGDDDNLYDDEDGITTPLLAYARPDTTYTKAVQCTGDNANVAAWLDWNADGQFDDDERTTTTCDGGTATLTWNVKESMLDLTKSPGAYRSALRMVISTDPMKQITVNGMTSDGEVEDHPVTVVVPGITLHKQVVDGNGADAKRADLLSEWAFTPTVDQADGALETSPLKVEEQKTGLDGRATWTLRTSLAGDAAVAELNEANDAFKKLAPMTFTETVKDNYQFIPNVTCIVPEQPADEAWQPNRKAGTYAWPKAAPKVAHGDNSFTLSEATANTVATCTVPNQPFGQISVTPKIDVPKGEDFKNFTADPELRFKGTFTCTAPTTSPSPGKEVKGEWGPVKAGEQWTSSLELKIPLGASCDVTQTAVTSEDPKNVEGDPQAGSYRFGWGEVSVAPQAVTAASALLGENVPGVTVTNPVVARQLATVRFDKVDDAEALLTGAKFALSGGPASASTGQPVVNVSFVDATTAEAAKAGPDTNAAKGKHTIVDLPLGTYTLTELEAPVGFIKLDQPIQFELKAEHAETGLDLSPIKNERVSGESLPAMPLTGGLGEDAFTIGGLAIGIFAAIAGAVALRRRKMGTA